MWPVYATEIQRRFVDALSEEEAAAIRVALSQVHAHAQRDVADATR